MEPGTLLVIAGLVAAGIATGVSNLRTRRAFDTQRRHALDEARAEVGSQVSSMADEMLALTDRIALSEHTDPESTRLFAEASATYQQACDALERARTARELETAADDLDHARWQLESAKAMVEGRESPAPPDVEQACFFDPTHGAGTGVVAIDTSAGRREVRVCSYCATKLRSGQAPQPRMIEVGGARVPAAKAPRSHGGGGMDWLDDFSVVMEGVTRPYGWGGYGGPRPPVGRR